LSVVTDDWIVKLFKLPLIIARFNEERYKNSKIDHRKVCAITEQHRKSKH
jgi:hypothetical protein